MSELDELRAETAHLEQQIRELTQGSAWRVRILNFVMAAEADGVVKELVDKKVRTRMEDFVRTEERWAEVSQALWDADLRLLVRDGKIFVSEDTEGTREWLLHELLRSPANA